MTNACNQYNITNKCVVRSAPVNRLFMLNQNVNDKFHPQPKSFLGLQEQAYRNSQDHVPSSLNAFLNEKSVG